MSRSTYAGLVARLSAAIWLAAAAPGCMGDGVEEECYDELDDVVPCEGLDDSPEMTAEPDEVEDLVALGGEDPPEDYLPGPDDLDGIEDEAEEVPLDEAALANEDVGASPFEVEEERPRARVPEGGVSSGRTDITWGRTRDAELRKLLPIGRTSGAQRFVIMRLRPADLPNLRPGDMLRAAAEIQVTTRCDVLQSGPGCAYTPKVFMQLLLSGSPDATNAHRQGTIALSGVEGFECTKDEHHCVKTINFYAASKRLADEDAPPCVADNSCFVNFVMWAYHRDARSGGVDGLLIGANEGNYLENGEVEQDRGRIMAVRERGLTPGDKVLRVTKRTVRGERLHMVSDGSHKRIYSHTLKGGRDLRAGEKYRVWALVNASSDHRVNLSLEFFLTRNRYDRNGGAVDGTSPRAISEHNGTNCSPLNPCHLRKVAVFQVDRDIRGPVYANIAARCEVPGPGFAHVTIRNDGFVKSIRYAH